MAGATYAPSDILIIKKKITLDKKKNLCYTTQSLHIYNQKETNMNHIIVCHNKIGHLKKAIVDAGYQVARTWYPKDLVDKTSTMTYEQVLADCNKIYDAILPYHSEPVVILTDMPEAEVYKTYITLCKDDSVPNNSRIAYV